MSYLYGDSTHSKLEVNYIEFLRDAVEFCVQVLLADQRITQGRTHIRALEHAAVAEAERLQKLQPLVAKAFEGTPLGALDSASARCAAAILRSSSELVRAEVVAMRNALDTEIAMHDAQASQERDGSVKALETLLIKHELPATTVDLHLVVTGGTRYACRARVKTGFGLEAVIDLDVPPNHFFDKVVRLDRLAERLDVLAPEMGGWLHKEVKRKPQHLEKLHVSELSIGGAGATLKLRTAADGTGTGFDVMFSHEAPSVRMLRQGTSDQQEASSEEAFDVDDGDARKLLAVHDKLVKAASELTAHRKRLVEAKIDGEPMRAHAKPTVLAERLIATMAPVVQEIAARSQSPDELVLRRLLSGDRREEIFMSKSELKAKLEPLVNGSRSLFDPLWIQALPPASPAKPPVPADKSATGASPHTQTIPFRPAATIAPTPTIRDATHAPVPPPLPAARPAAEPPATDLRRTLIGTTAQTVEPADSVSKTPVVMMEPPDLPREVAGTIEIAVAKAADPTHRS